MADNAQGWIWITVVLGGVGAVVAWLLHLSSQMSKARREASQQRLQAEIYKARLEAESETAERMRDKLRDAGILIHPGRNGSTPKD